MSEDRFKDRRHDGRFDQAIWHTTHDGSARVVLDLACPRTLNLGEVLVVVAYVEAAPDGPRLRVEAKIRPT